MTVSEYRAYPVEFSKEEIQSYITAGDYLISILTALKEHNCEVLCGEDCYIQFSELDAAANLLHTLYSETPIEMC